MNYTEVVYSRTKNLGNYESEKVELRCAVDESDNVEDSVALVKMKALEVLGIIPTPDKIVEVVEGGNVVTEDGKTVDPSNGEEVKKEKPKKKATVKKTTKKKVAKKKEEVPEIPPKIYTLEDVKEALKGIWKKKGKSIAMDILKNVGGVEKSDNLDPKKFNVVMDEVTKCLK